MIAVLFAVQHESRDFRRRLRDVREVEAGGLRLLRGKLDGVEVAVAHSGVGLAAADRTARWLVEEARPAWLINAGYAGGLRVEMRVGDVVVDWRTVALPISAALPAGCFAGTITSHIAALETPEEKSAFARKTGALAVDMESAAIAKVFAEAGVPMIAVRAISDAWDEALPVPLERWFNLHRQRPRPAALLAFLATHPARILPFWRFVRQLPRTRIALTRAVSSLVGALAAATPRC